MTNAKKWLLESFWKDFTDNMLIYIVNIGNIPILFPNIHSLINAQEYELSAKTRSRTLYKTLLLR